MDCFQNSPKVNNIFGLLLRAYLLQELSIWSHRSHCHQCLSYGDLNGNEPSPHPNSMQVSIIKSFNHEKKKPNPKGRFKTNLPKCFISFSKCIPLSFNETKRNQFRKTRMLLNLNIDCNELSIKLSFCTNLRISYGSKRLN